MSDEPTDQRITRSSLRPVYVERINAAIDYIEQHRADDLTLEDVAAVAHFSPFHFHRIFSVLVGETPGRFINRVRLERAATLLAQQPARSVTHIGAECGFANPSSFARAFRDFFAMSATEWREGGYQSYERSPGDSYRDMIGNLGSLDDSYGIEASELDTATGDMRWRIRCNDLAPATVTIEHFPELEVAYIRHTGRYQGLGEVFTKIFTRLMNWAAPRGLVTPDSWILAIYHDNPSITDDDRLRVSACINVPSGTPASGGIGRMTMAGGAYAVGHFELGEQDYGKAWFALAGGWLPDSGYEPDDRYPLERFPADGSTTSSGKQAVDICLPVRPLNLHLGY